ncbi:GreA/GreB family elongation factor [Nocardia africana]|uniref:GreA/GreB family elongation factor n=1 Tax=Nocardia africana TaxID=134964 RepID=A0ABW6NU20_9NOCA
MARAKQVIALVWSHVLLAELDDDDTIARYIDYTIVPDDHADPASGRYSESLPTGKALLGHVTGDYVETTIDGAHMRLLIQGVGAR